METRVHQNVCPDRCGPASLRPAAPARQEGSDAAVFGLIAQRCNPAYLSALPRPTQECFYFYCLFRALSTRLAADYKYKLIACGRQPGLTDWCSPARLASASSGRRPHQPAFSPSLGQAAATQISNIILATVSALAAQLAHTPAVCHFVCIYCIFMAHLTTQDIIIIVTSFNNYHLYLIVLK